MAIVADKTKKEIKDEVERIQNWHPTYIADHVGWLVGRSSWGMVL